MRNIEICSKIQKFRNRIKRKGNRQISAKSDFFSWRKNYGKNHNHFPEWNEKRNTGEDKGNRHTRIFRRHDRQIESHSVERERRSRLPLPPDKGLGKNRGHHGGKQDGRGSLQALALLPSCRRGEQALPVFKAPRGPLSRIRLLLHARRRHSDFHIRNLRA